MKFAKLRQRWFKFLLKYDVQIGVFILSLCVVVVVGVLGMIL